MAQATEAQIKMKAIAKIRLVISRLLGLIEGNIRAFLCGSILIASLKQAMWQTTGRTGDNYIV
jgi:hypothetical protein